MTVHIRSGTAGGSGVILPWTTATAYLTGQPVTNGGHTYTAADAHTSGATFAGDLATHWTLLPVTKADVGLSSANNTADTAKPVSTAQQAALDLKAPVGAGQVTGALGLPVVAEITETFDHTLTSDHTSYDSPAGMAAATQATYEIPRRLLRNTGEIRYLYVNQGAYNITVRCGAGETANATAITAGYFDGKRSVVIEPGGYALSDPIPFDKLAGAILYERTWVQVAGGETWKITAWTGASASQAGVDKTAAGSLSGIGTRPFCAMAVLGPSGGSSVAVFADSIGWGSGDVTRSTGANSGVGQGFLSRACGPAGVLLLNLSKPGEAAQSIATDSTVRVPRWRFIGAVTKGILALSTNDLQGGRTLAQLQGDWATIGLMLQRRTPAVTLYGCTCVPKSTSTDAYATLVNQTRSTPPGDHRGNFNAWLRAGAPIDPTSKAAVAIGTSGALLAGQAGHWLAGVFDVAATVESGDLWKAPITGTATTTNGSPTLTAVTGTWVAGMPISGTGIPASSAIGTVVGTTLTLVNQNTGNAVNATASASGVAITTGALTGDGIHPSSVGHALMATAVTTSLLL